MIDNMEMDEILTKLESLEDEQLAVKLLKEFNDKTVLLDKLLLNLDQSIKNEDWKKACDEAKKDVDEILKQIDDL